jgi:hypothetical protein
MRSRRGNVALEAVLFIPILILFFVATEQLGKLTYTYFTLKKVVNTAARYIATQQGVNACDAADPNIVAGINFALTGTTDGSLPTFVGGLTSDMFLVSAESFDVSSGTAATYDCSLGGIIAPDFIVVSIPDGYQVTPIIPFLTLTPILLKPRVKVAYGGT